MKINDDLPIPNNEIIEKYISIYKNDNKAFSFDKSITEIINKFPFNVDIDSVIIKVSIINDLYSTNLFSKYELAKHILNLNFDEAIASKDYTIVNRIATGHGINSSKTNKEFNFYSFATKYCSWHDQKNFPIFDRYIEFVLKKYNKKDSFTKDINFNPLGVIICSKIN